MSDEENGDLLLTEENGAATEELIQTPTSGTAKKRTAKAPAASRPGVAVKRRSKKPVPSKDEAATRKFIKYAALFLLVAQMVGLVLLMRYSRTHKAADQPMYLSSSAVFVMELMKFFICCVVVTYQSGGALLSELQQHVIQSPMEVLKLCVPSLLYTVQNNLLYLALSNLDAATYQICYQLKILTTALFSALLLQRKFSRVKWTSLVILTLGVAIVEVSGSGDEHTSDSSALSSQNRLVGLVAVLCAACTSGFSGVYFERILKGSSTSLWIRNIQMGLPSILIAYVTVYLKDAVAVQSQGMLGGYTGMVWTVVTVQAAGGLIVAVVVKYADNVLKVFATSFSIIVTGIISAVLFGFRPTFSFVVGASLVVLATVLYSAPEKSRRRKRRSPVLPMTTGNVNRG